MKKPSQFDLGVLALTAAFLLLCVAGYLRSIPRPGQWLVTGQGDGTNSQSAAQSQSNWPDSLLAGERIDLNRADAADLARLPGIGPARAETIVAYRQIHGPFESVDELEKIRGIGAATVDGLRPYVKLT